MGVLAFEKVVLAFENRILAFENGVLTFEKGVLAFDFKLCYSNNINIALRVSTTEFLFEL